MTCFREIACIERWPKHPEEKCANHCECHWSGALFNFNFGSWSLFQSKNQTCSKAEIGSKSMDDCASSCIVNVNELVADDFIEAVSYDLNHGHDQKLIWSHSSENGSECNKDRSNRIRSSCEVVFSNEDSESVPTSM